jgi:hypothetical protein
MTDAQRLTYLKFGAIGMFALLLLDFVVIEPAFAQWKAQSDRIQDLREKVERGQELLDREQTIRSRWTRMQHANLPTEVAAAESQAFQAIARWARVSGITFASLTPQWQDHDEGYQTLECRASATGSQAELSRFIYELETDKLPVSLEECEISTRDERGEALTMTAQFSFLRMNLSGSTTQ